MFNEIDFSKIDTSITPPQDDTERQYYYMAKLAEMVALRERELGRRITYCLQTFGCQMNARDSEKLLGILTEIGYVPVETEEADLVLYNTCTVRENANLKVYGRLGHLHSLKDQNPDMKIIPISARTGEGMDEWIDWLKEETSSWNESNEKGVNE